MFEHTIDVLEHSILAAESSSSMYPGNHMIKDAIEEMKKAIEVLKNYEE